MLHIMKRPGTCSHSKVQFIGDVYSTIRIPSSAAMPFIPIYPDTLKLCGRNYANLSIVSVTGSINSLISLHSLAHYTFQQILERLTILLRHTDKKLIVFEGETTYTRLSSVHRKPEPAIQVGLIAYAQRSPGLEEE